MEGGGMEGGGMGRTGIWLHTVETCVYGIQSKKGSDTTDWGEWS